MLNHNKRSITLDTKNPKGKEVLTALNKSCDVLVAGEFRPRRARTAWVSLGEDPGQHSEDDRGLDQGLWPRTVRRLQGLWSRTSPAQCTGGAASTTGFRDGLPAGHRRGADRRQRHRVASGARHRHRAPISGTVTGKGQKVTAAMQDGVLNLQRVKLRDQQRLAHGPLKEYSQYGEGIPFGDAGAARRQRFRRRPARPHPQMQGLRDRSQRLHLFHHPGPGLGEDLRDVIGEPGWKTHPRITPSLLHGCRASTKSSRASNSGR